MLMAIKVFDSLLSWPNPAMAYVVVIFTDTEEVGVVVSTWITGKSKMLWPFFKSPAALTKAVKERLQPDPNTWTSHNVRVLCACSKFYI